MTSPKSPTALDEAFRAQRSQREAKAEFQSCLIFIATTLAIFVVVATFGGARHFHSANTLRIIFLLYLGLVATFAVLVRKGLWHSSLRYLNTTLQIMLLSAFLIAVTREKGVAFALTTALPMMYCLVISMTAFRLSPWLSLYAGALSALGLVFVYTVFMRPELTSEILAANPTLGWTAVYARVMVLIAIGVACALAANSLRVQIRRQEEDQGRIQLLERTFGRLVAPEVAKQILEDENWMKPARREAVIMFADLQGFTKYSEDKSPEDVADFLNRCWSVAADIVEKHGGVINKYMGDGFLAIFGVPLELVEAEKAAAETAAELDRELAPLLKPDGLALCIGLHAGPMIVGGIGSEARCEFTVIGSTVNLASRLETLNRALATRCLTSGEVAAKISGDWHMKDHGGHQVKGVAREVSVFELGGKKAISELVSAPPPPPD